MFTQLFLENFWLKFFVSIIASYLLSAVGIKAFIAYMKHRALYQPIRADGPESHLKNKKNTPTMGGIFIVLSTIVTSLLFLDLSNQYIWVAIFVFTCFALIGLTDDLMKVIYKNPNGFRGSIKLIIQFLIIGAAFLWLSFIDPTHGTSRVFVPIMGSHYLTLGLVLYVLFITVVIVGTSNAVNLTDGLDGLVSVPAIISLLCLIFIIFHVCDRDAATALNVPYIQNCEELIFFCASLIGAILGFLQFNLKPAKIFMGDVGSLAIGSALGLIAVITKQEIIFFVISLLFVTEAMSVILQVASYKLRKKRIFLMAPIHHHFEKLGWGEKSVVRRFWFFSLCCAVAGLAWFVG